MMRPKSVKSVRISLILRKKRIKMKIMIEDDRVITEPTPSLCLDRVTIACFGTANFDGKATSENSPSNTGSLKWKKQIDELTIQSRGN
jgi:hypothetical protein